MDSSSSSTSTSNSTRVPPLWCVHHGGAQVEQVRAASALAARRVVAKRRGLPFAVLGAVMVGPAVTLLPPRPAGPSAGQ